MTNPPNYSLWKIIMKTPILILLEVFSSSRLCYHWLYVFTMLGCIQQHAMLPLSVFICYGWIYSTACYVNDSCIYLLLHVNKLLIIACYLSWCVMNNQI